MKTEHNEQCHKCKQYFLRGTMGYQQLEADGQDHDIWTCQGCQE